MGKYTKEKREENTAKCKAWRDRNPEAVKRRRAIDAAASKEKTARLVKRYHESNKEAMASLAEELRAGYQDFYESYPYLEESRAKSVNIFRRERTPSWNTKKDIELINDMYLVRDIMSQLIGVPHHVDHIIPMHGYRVSGLHVPSNITIAPGGKNIRKSNYYDTMQDWILSEPDDNGFRTMHLK